MVVVHARVDGSGQPTSYFSWAQCNDTANGGKGYAYATEPITRGSNVTTINLASCSLACLAPNSFAFDGASNVTSVSIGDNPFVALPEQLLRNLSSLRYFHAERLTKLETLPEAFFSGLGQLQLIDAPGWSRFGVEERLPDALFQGLTSLAELNLGDCRLKHLPSLNGLAALTSLKLYANADGNWHMDAEESASKFDSLTSVALIIATDTQLSRIPSLKRLGMLNTLWLSNNKITRIGRGAFKGATQLLMLELGGNQITSVAAGAFAVLTAMRFTPDIFAKDNAQWRDDFGTALWLQAGEGRFGGGKSYAVVPIAWAPNMVECRYVGPYVSDLNCSTCVLGYETTSALNTTCVKPGFKPYRGWLADYSRLWPHDTHGLPAKGSARTAERTSTPALLAQHTYTIPAPRLEPKERRFVGPELCPVPHAPPPLTRTVLRTSGP